MDATAEPDDPARRCRQDLRRWHRRRARARPRGGPRGDDVPGRSVGLRQVHDAEDDQPADRAHEWPDLARRPRRHLVDPVELRRGIGYVIQQVGLFPHQTVATNVATVLSLLGTPKAEARPRAVELLDLVGPGPGPVRRPLSRAALGRPAAACRRGPGAGRGPAGAADGRAVRGRRPRGAGAPAGRVPAAPARAPQDRRAGHPRHRRGGVDRRPGGGLRHRRSARPGRHAAGGGRLGRPTTSSPTSSGRPRACGVLP